MDSRNDRQHHPLRFSTLALKRTATNLIAACSLVLSGCSDVADPEDEELGDTEAEISNGTLVQPGQWNAVAFLATQKTFNPAGVLSHCTGSLIGNQWVLTAAHCLRCAATTAGAVQVRFMQGSTVAGQPGPTVYQSIANGSFIHPDAFFETTNCSSPPSQGETARTGRDIALVKLSTAVAITPMNVLYDAPVGFSPTQDLFNVPLTIVGRGETELDLGNVSSMRQGQTKLKFYRPEDHTTVCGATDLEPFALGCQLFDAGEGSAPNNSSILHGDSGGPMLWTLSGSLRIIGIASRVGNDETSHAPTFTKANADFIRSTMTPSFVGNQDADADGVINTLDNCVGDYNPDQIDRDGDGDGDVCDNCTPLVTAPDTVERLPSALTEFDGIPTSTFAAFANSGQQNCNIEAETQALVAVDATYVDPVTGLPDRLNEARYEAGVATGHLDCATAYLSRLRRAVRGDVCDPIPCGQSEALLTEVSTSQAPAFTCTLQGFPGLCKYLAPGTVSTSPKRDTGSTPGSNGYRYCPCADPHGTAGERRTNCGFGSLAGCVIDPNRYTPLNVEDANWKWMSLNSLPASGTSTLSANYGPTTAKVSTSWQSLTDLSRLNGNQALPPTPWDASDFDSNGEFLTGPKLKGVLWSHVRSLNGQVIGTIPNAPGGRSYALNANQYNPADLIFDIKVPHIRVIRYAPAWKWSYCPGCMLGEELSWIYADSLSNWAAVAAQPSKARYLTNAVTADAKSLLESGHLRISASESDRRLRDAGLVRREVLIDASNDTWPTMGGLGVDGSGDVVGSLREPFLLAMQGDDTGVDAAADDNVASSLDEYDFELAPPGTEAVEDLWDVDSLELSDSLDGGQSLATSSSFTSVFAFGALENEIFAIRSRDASTPSQFFRYRVAGGVWAETPTSGAALGTPLALLFRVEDSALYVIDRALGATTGGRLVRIDIFTNNVTVLVTNFLAGTFTNVALGQNDSQLIVGIRAGTTMKLAHVEVVGTTVTTRNRHTATTPFSGTLAENAAGVHHLIDSVHSYEPRLVPLSSFVNGSSSASPVF